MRSITILIATFFYSGLAPKAPGTFGTLAASAVITFTYVAGLPLAFFTSFEALFSLIILYAVGWFFTDRYMHHTGKHDPKEVVIDEVLGIYITYAIFLLFFPSVYKDITAFAIISLLLFVTFRFFDIVKPFPVSYFDKKWDNAHGVMLDDAAAGIYAGFVSAGAYQLYTLFVI